MTELGGSTPISEARVEAGNWMTALARAREQLGELGAVPPGASCSVAADGNVTIHDAVARKTYRLIPEPRPKSNPPAAAVPRPSRPPTAAPAGFVKGRTVAYSAQDLGVPGAPPKKPEPAPAEAKKADAKKADTKKPESKRPEAKKADAKKTVAKRTIAYDAAELGIAPPKKPDPKPDEPAPKRTVAYDAAELGLAPPKKPDPKPDEPAPKRTVAYDAAELGLAPPAPPKDVARSPSQVEIPATPARGVRPIAPASSKSKPGMKSTIAYDARELGLPGAPAPPAGTDTAADEPPRRSPSSQPPRRDRPKTTRAYDAKDLGLEIPPEFRDGPRSEPELPAPAPPEVERPTMPDATRATERPMWELLHSRDEEPTRETPLVYRERTYWVPAETSPLILESILLARFEELREELADRPKGKLVNMALFDHRWDERPLGPPLLTLQWKDWRGEPIVKGRRAPSPSRPPPTESMPPPSWPPRGQAVAVAPAPSAPPAAPPSDELDLGIVDEPVFGRAPPPTFSSHDDRLAAAFEALQDLSFLTTPVEGLDFAVRLLDDLVPSEAGSACLYDINTDEFRFVALLGPGADHRQGSGVPRLNGLIGVAALAPGEAVAVCDVARDPRYDPAVDGRDGLAPPRSMLLAAVTHHGRLLGLLQLINRRDHDAFSAADGHVVTYVAEKLGEFLHGARTRSDDRQRA